MIQKERIKLLGGRPVRGGAYVLYWMQASQRAEDNHALEFAVEQANERGLPVLAFFGLTPDYPGANLRHYAFMLEGLAEVRRALEERGIALVVRPISPDAGAVELSKRAALAVVDRGYVRIERAWRERAAERAACPLIQVETNVIIPVEEASDKEEYAAATLRPKVRRLLPKYLVPLKTLPVKKKRLAWDLETLDLRDVDAALARLPIDRSVGRVRHLVGGASHARRHLRSFLKNNLRDYAEKRSDPAQDLCSHLSAYLHFGQVSPLAVALEAKRAAGAEAGGFLEELVVRRELSMNFVFYSPRYDAFEALPAWCRKTLKTHERDKRETVYARSALEAGRTHDPYWNAAQKEMVCTGRMHNTMRMYWGKKLLEWHRRPQDAFRTALALNNKYELDGRDPNGFAGVAWCFGKHDRPWRERPVFGMVRAMTGGGLARKYDMDGYVRRVEEACTQAPRPIPAIRIQQRR